MCRDPIRRETGFMFGKKGTSGGGDKRTDLSFKFPSKSQLVAGLMGALRNLLLVLSWAAIVVLAIVGYVGCNYLGGGNAGWPAIAVVGLILGGGFLTLYVGRKWDFIPY